MKDYNKTVMQLFGPKKVAGEVGIEIEMEGNNLPHANPTKMWNYHEDHSLRGPENAEYVLRVPIHRNEVEEELDSLFGQLKGSGAKIRKDSPNTSVHVHLNVQELSLKRVYTISCLWYILEEMLMDWCGTDRVGNVFCLRASDAEVALQRLASAVRYGKYQDLIDQDGLRYAALNYTALTKFGSLEFRGLSGVYDKETILTWVKILLALKDFAGKYDNPSDVIAEFSRTGPEEFLRLVLPNGLYKEVETNDSPRQLREGMRMIQNVAFCVNWERDDPVGEKKKGSPGAGESPVKREFVDEAANVPEIEPLPILQPIRGRREPLPVPDWRQLVGQPGLPQNGVAVRIEEMAERQNQLAGVQVDQMILDEDIPDDERDEEDQDDNEDEGRPVDPHPGRGVLIQQNVDGGGRHTRTWQNGEREMWNGNAQAWVFIGMDMQQADRNNRERHARAGRNRNGM